MSKSPALLPFLHQPCGCKVKCGDDGDVDGPGTCKGLPLPPREPLVEIVLVDRQASRGT